MSKIHVIRANTDPVGNPERAGIHWINQTSGKIWLSSALAGVPFWKEDDLDSHLAAPDPHPQYETSAEAQAKVDAHANRTDNPHATTKAQVGLGNADNTSDVNKPVSTAQQAALDLKANLSLIGQPSGIAGLDSGGKVPAAQLPSFVDDVLEYANLAAFPVTGETGKIYTALDTGKIYRWSGSVYVEISASPGSTDAVPEGVVNLYFTTARVLATVLAGLNTALTGNITSADTILIAFGRIQNQLTANLATLNAHIANTSNPHATTKTQVGLGNVPNVDATDRNNHTGTQLASTISDFSTAADARITAQKGAANGIATLDSGSKIPAAQLPSFVDDVLEYVNLAAFPVTGETGKIYTALDTGKIYRWSGSVYVEISASPGSTDAVPEGVTNLYFTVARVLATALTGLPAFTNVAILATDTVLQAFAKLQGQVTARALAARQILNGYGITGGGDLTDDRTLAVSLVSSVIEQTNSVTSTGVADTQIASFNVAAPTTGTYLAIISARIESTIGDSIGTARMFANGVAQTATIRTFGCNAQGGSANNFRGTINMTKIVSLTAAQVVDMRWSHSVASFNILDRSITLLRIA